MFPFGGTFGISVSENRIHFSAYSALVSLLLRLAQPSFDLEGILEKRGRRAFAMRAQSYRPVLWALVLLAAVLSVGAFAQSQT